MSTLSFILASDFDLTAPGMAGVSDARLPDVGTFAYDGSAIVTPTKQVIVVAFR